MDEASEREERIEQWRAERAQAVALKAIGISSMTINSLRRHRRETGDARWLDPDWLATRTTLDLMGVRNLGKVGREKLMAAVDQSKPCPCCNGTGRVPRDSAA